MLSSMSKLFNTARASGSGVLCQSTLPRCWAERGQCRAHCMPLATADSDRSPMPARRHSTSLRTRDSDLQAADARAVAAAGSSDSGISAAKAMAPFTPSKQRSDHRWDAQNPMMHTCSQGMLTLVLKSMTCSSDSGTVATGRPLLQITPSGPP